MNKKTVVVRSKRKKQSKLSLFFSQFFKQKAVHFLVLAIILLAIPLTIVQGSHLQDNRQRASGFDSGSGGPAAYAPLTCEQQCVQDGLSENATEACINKCNGVTPPTTPQECYQGCISDGHSDATCRSSCGLTIRPYILIPATCDNNCEQTMCDESRPDGTCKGKSTRIDQTCKQRCDAPVAPQSAPPSVGGVGGDCIKSCYASCEFKPDTCYTACDNKCKAAGATPETSGKGGTKTSSTTPSSSSDTPSDGSNTSSEGNSGGSSSTEPVATSVPQKQVSCSDNPIPAGEHKIWKAYCDKVCVTNSDCKSLPGWPDASQCYPFTNGSYCIQLQYNNIAGLCRDNPVLPPDGLSWKASCSQECTQNSDCPTTPGLANSNWCYGFDDGARCLQLQHKNALASAPKDIFNAARQQVNTVWDEVVSFFSNLTKHK